MSARFSAVADLCAYLSKNFRVEKFSGVFKRKHSFLGEVSIILICAAEIAEDCIHPVTRCHLGELLSMQEMTGKVEFIAQGKTLVLEAS